MMWYDMMYDVMWYGVMWCDMMWYDIWYDMKNNIIFVTTITSQTVPEIDQMWWHLWIQNMRHVF